MTNEQILKKAIKKAVKNGWKEGEYYIEHWYIYKDKVKEISFIFAILFDHDFAKVIFGEERVDFGDGLTKQEYKQAILDLPEDKRRNIRKWGIEGTQIRWQYHFQQLVFESDPLKYLEKFLK